VTPGIPLSALGDIEIIDLSVSCLPVKIEAASAGWCRAVALVPREA
jgi:hypothetical protein